MRSASFATALATLSLSLGLRLSAGAESRPPLEWSFRVQPKPSGRIGQAGPTAYLHSPPEVRAGGASGWQGSCRLDRPDGTAIFGRSCPKFVQSCLEPEWGGWSAPPGGSLGIVIRVNQVARNTQMGAILPSHTSLLLRADFAKMRPGRPSSALGRVPSIRTRQERHCTLNRGRLVGWALSLRVIVFT